MMDGDSVVEAARRWVGTPYRHQASNIGVGADCLGLIRGIWRELIGPEPEAPPAYTADWGETTGEELLFAATGRWMAKVPKAEHRAGDVILFRMRDKGPAKHLAIAAFRDDAPSFLHAYTGHGVIETMLTQPWQRKVASRFEFPLGGR